MLERCLERGDSVEDAFREYERYGSSRRNIKSYDGHMGEQALSRADRVRGP